MFCSTTFGKVRYLPCTDNPQFARFAVVLYSADTQAFMASNILSEILEWSHSRPVWQRDALRRLFTSDGLTHADLTDLLDLCKAAHGLSPARTGQPLATEHLAIVEGDETPVSLSRLVHHKGVNALAPEQTLSFGPQLTVVYGDNASGKSGYTRILKQACRARVVENILGDVLSGSPPLSAKATITVHVGNDEHPVEWGPTAPPPAELARISVFDSHCAPVYLRDKTEVAFRPFGLDVFDKLAAACGQIRQLLESESAQLSTPFVIPAGLLPGTKPRVLAETLSALTRDAQIVSLATFSPAEEQRLKELEETDRDLKASDPKQRARELAAKAQRLTALADHVGNVISHLGLSNLSQIKDLAATRDSADSRPLAGHGRRGLAEHVGRRQ